MSNAFGTLLETGPLQTIDPLALEPGVILFDRFCVLEPARMQSAGQWEVAATDLRRELGGTPHHRVNLIYLPPAVDIQRLRRAAETSPGRHVQALAAQPCADGLILVAPPRPTNRVGRLRREAWLTFAVDLAGILSAYHHEGLTGVAFDADSTQFDGIQTTIYGFTHLLRQGTAERDVGTLIDFLSEFTDEDLPPALSARPTTALELWERLKSTATGATGHNRLRLPSVPPFVGRQQILDALMRGSEQARQGDQTVSLVTAASGGGKTRLLQQLAINLERWMDITALWGTFESTMPLRFSGFVEALSGLPRIARGLPEPEREQLRRRILDAVGPLAGVVSTLTQELREYLGEHPLPAELDSDKQFLRHAAVIASAIRAIGTPRRPLLLVLDNAHRAEAAALEVLRNLVEDPSRHHTHVVLAGWSEATQVVGALSQQTHVLEPLTVTDVSNLLGATLPVTLSNPVDVARRLRHASSGYPLATWVTLQSWVEANFFRMQPDSDEWTLAAEANDSTELVELYRHQFERLKPHEVWVAVVLALRPGRTHRSWIETVLNWGASEVERGIDGLCRSGLLIAEPGGTVRFPHDSVRSFIVGTTRPDVTARAHQVIAAWIKQHGDEDELPQYAWHLEHATLPGPQEPLADAHLDSGLRCIRIYELERAEWHFRQAIARTNDTARALVAREGLGHVELLSGRTQNALRVYEEVVASSDDAAQRVLIAARAAHGLYRRGEVGPGIALAATALRGAGEPFPVGGARLYAALALAALQLVVPSRPRPELLRDALCQLYVALIVSTVDSPILVLLSILRGARHARDLRTTAGSQILSFFSAFLDAVGFKAASSLRLHRAHVLASGLSDEVALGTHAHIRGQTDVAAGRYADGIRWLDESVRLHARSGDHSIAVLALLYKAIYGRNRETTEGLFDVLQQAEAAAIRANTVLWRTTLSALRVSLRARRGDPVDNLLAELEAHLHTNPVTPAERLMTRFYVTLAYVQLGAIGDARRQVDLLEPELAANAGQLEILVEPNVAVLETLLFDDRGLKDGRVKRALRRLRNAGRRSPRLAVAARYYEARRAELAGRLRVAIDGYRQIAEDQATHGETWYTLRAHQMLAELEPATAQTGHLVRATRMAEALGLQAPAAAPASTDASPGAAPHPVEAPPDAETVDVADLVERLVPALEHALPPRTRFRADLQAEVLTTCVPEQLQLLVVNLVLAARDAVTGGGEIVLSVSQVDPADPRLQRIPLVRGAPYVFIEVRGCGFQAAEAISGLGVCCEITAGLNGFLDVSDDGPSVLVLTACVPSHAGSRAAPQAFDLPFVELVHADPRIRSTLHAALEQLGYRVGERHAVEDVRGTPVDLLFIDDEMLRSGDVVPADRTVVRLVARSAGAPRSDGDRYLRVPFAIGELTAILEQERPRPTA